MEIKTLEDRKNYLKNIEPKKGFKFKYIGDFTEKIKPIQDSFYDGMKWSSYGKNSWIYSTHGEVETYTLLTVPNFAQIDYPYAIQVMDEEQIFLGLCNPIFRELEELYKGKVAMCGFNKLSPWKSMPRHRDQVDGQQPFSPYYNVLRRLHIPLFTNEHSILWVSGEEKNLKVGECWEFNNNLYHEVWNDGDTNRVHLIIDILPHRWL